MEYPDNSRDRLAAILDGFSQEIAKKGHDWLEKKARGDNLLQKPKMTRNKFAA
jgi:hypothetical protein